MDDTSDPVQAVCDLITTGLLDLLDEGGADAPAVLWEIDAGDLDDEVRAAMGAAQHRRRVRAAVGDQALHEAVGPTGHAFGVRVARVLDGEVYAALVGLSADDDAVGVALTTEGWATDESGRREVRLAHVVLRDGTESFRCRPIGGGPVEARGDKAPDGRVPGALRRCIGRPSGLEVGVDVAACARRWWASLVATLVAGSERAGAGDEVAELIVELACADPGSLLSAAGGPAAALAGALEGAGWDTVLAALAGDDDPEWAELGEWYDAGLLADHLGEGPDPAAALELIEDVVGRDAAQAVARVLDGGVPGGA